MMNTKLDTFKQTDQCETNSNRSYSPAEISQSISQLKSLCSTNLLFFKGSERGQNVYCFCFCLPGSSSGKENTQWENGMPVMVRWLPDYGIGGIWLEGHFIVSLVL